MTGHYALVAEDLTELFLANLRQGREHHDNEANSDGDVRRARLKTIDEPSRRRYEVPDRHTNCHCEKDPQGQEAIEKG
jgi:hypothetical protein